MALSTIARRVAAFRKNNAVSGELFRVAGLAPVTVVCENQGSAVCVVSAYRISSAGVAGRADQSASATSVASENSGYTGNGVTLAFSGQVLNNLPVVPKSVRLTPATTGVDLLDGGDGIFYTDDTDSDEAGTINYFTGALTLAYPTGKAPDGQINAAYLYENDELNAYGRKAYVFNSLNPAETLVVGGAVKSPADGEKVQVEVISTGDCTFIGGGFQ